MDTRSCVSRCVASVVDEVEGRGADFSASAEVAASNSSVLAEEQVVVVVDGVVVVVDEVRYVNRLFGRRVVDDRVGEVDDRDGTVVHASKVTVKDPKKTAMTAKADTEGEEVRMRTERAMVMDVVVVLVVEMRQQVLSRSSRFTADLSDLPAGNSLRLCLLMWTEEHFRCVSLLPLVRFRECRRRPG